jgi:hypothetical protein
MTGHPGRSLVTGLAYPMWAGLTPGSNEARRVIPCCLFVAARRHHTCPRATQVSATGLLGGPPNTGLKNLKVLNPIPGLYDSDTGHRRS